MRELRHGAVEFTCGEVVLRGDSWTPDDSAGQVLLLHGGGQTRHSWGKTARSLYEAGWSATVVDLRGHGDSDWVPSGHYDVEANAADVASIVSQLTAPPVLVGASLGGLAALTAAAHTPAAIRGLVLVDIVPRANRAGVRRILEFMLAHGDGFATLDDVDAIAEYKRRPRRGGTEGLHKAVRRHEDGRWYWHWDPRLMSRQREIDGDPPVRHEELLAAARRVTAPTLIVRGADSDVVDDDGVEELRRALTGATVAHVQGAGHMVAGDENDAFTATLLGYLQSLLRETVGSRPSEFVPGSRSGPTDHR